MTRKSNTVFSIVKTPKVPFSYMNKTHNWKSEIGPFKVGEKKKEKNYKKIYKVFSDQHESVFSKKKKKDDGRRIV